MHINKGMATILLNNPNITIFIADVKHFIYLFYYINNIKFFFN